MPRKRVTKKQISDAIVSCGGIKSAIARKLGISRQAVQQRIAEDSELSTLCEYQREELLDRAEHGLALGVRKKEPWAIRFTLQTLGANRGYAKQHVHDVPVLAGPVGRVILSMPDDGREGKRAEDA